MLCIKPIPPPSLKSRLGGIGEQLYCHSYGIDYSKINEKYIPVSKSCGNVGLSFTQKRSWPGINSRIVKSFLIEITLRYIGIEQEDKDQAVSSLGL